MRDIRIAVRAEDGLSELALASCLTRLTRATLTEPAEADILIVATAAGATDLIAELRARPLPSHVRVVLVADEPVGIGFADPILPRVHAQVRRTDFDPVELVRVVQEAAEGRPASAPPRPQQDHGQVVRARAQPPGRHAERRSLSAREAEVLRMVAQGLELSEIADRMSFSERTIKKAISSTMGSLGSRNRVQAVACAIRSGLI